MDNVMAQKLRNLAFGKLKMDRSKFADDELKKIESIEINYGAYRTVRQQFVDVVRQIEKDVKIYKKYDCLAIWLDWELGLVKYEPDLIERIAREVGGLKIEGE